MIDHITINVRELQKSKAFYEDVLAALGMSVNIGSEEDCFWGFGTKTEPEFEITAGRLFISQGDEAHPVVPGGVHIAFRAANHAAVKAFYDAALSAGGRDNGAPGIRQQYGEHYFAAFVLDPDGNNIEAVAFEE